MLLTDNHTHTRYSTDSDTPVVDQIEAAVRLGLSGITITDHLDPDFPLDSSAFIFDTDSYYRELCELQARYKDKIDIRIGVEIGMRTDQKGMLEELAAGKPYDFVIGSIHVVDGYDPYYEDYWKDYGAKRGLERFFETTLECVKMFDFYDTLGHIDYIFRYVPKAEASYAPGDFRSLIDEILRTLILKDKALEINTAGVKYGLSYPHPSPYILKRYKELGGTKLTLGSDGHKPEHLAYAFGDIPKYIKDNGFSSYYRYISRNGIEIKL